jgi:hypothetical protein
MLDAKRKPSPPRSGAPATPSVTLTPAQQVQPEKRYPEQPILPPPVEFHPDLPFLPERKRTAEDFFWRPTLVDFKLKITFWDADETKIFLVKLPENASRLDIQNRLSECYEGRRFQVTYSKGPRYFAVSEMDPDAIPAPPTPVQLSPLDQREWKK